MRTNIEEMDEDELREVLKERYGFEIDELKILYKDADELRAAIKNFESYSGSDVDESKIGWDSEDKTVLTADQTRAVEERKKMIEKLAKARAKLLKAKTVEEKEALKEEIRQTGAELTPEEIRATMKDVRKLLGNMDDDDE